LPLLRLVSARHGITEVRVLARQKVGQLPLAVDDRLRDRFWAKVRKLDGDDSCWLWTGAWRGQGYGAIKIDGAVMDAHVVSWRLANHGIAVPDGKLIAHRCDVRPCVRPGHLFLASWSENMIDARDKGRLQDSWSYGERHPHAVLTEDLVRKARSLHADGMSGRKVADEIGVKYDCIKDVLSGKRWKHVTD
jgi:hypothetical protein